MERQWGDLDRYRGISTSSKGALKSDLVDFLSFVVLHCASCCKIPCMGS